MTYATPLSKIATKKRYKRLPEFPNKVNPKVCLLMALILMQTIPALNISMESISQFNSSGNIFLSVTLLFHIFSAVFPVKDYPCYILGQLLDPRGATASLSELEKYNPKRIKPLKETFKQA